MGTTVKDILVAARAKIVAVAPTRDAAALFLEHTTNQPFEDSPIVGRDGFEVVAREDELIQGFGVSGDKEGQFRMVVKLGHSPYTTDKERENNLQRDIARLGDILEQYAFPAGTQGVWFMGASTNKTRPNWWVSELVFRVVYTGAVDLT